MLLHKNAHVSTHTLHMCLHKGVHSVFVSAFGKHVTRYVFKISQNICNKCVTVQPIEVHVYQIVVHM